MRASTYPLMDPVEAADLVLHLTPVLPVEEVPVSAAWGRVLGEDLVAPRQLPPFPASAVDGYAFRAGGERRLRVVGESAAGRPFLETLLAADPILRALRVHDHRAEVSDGNRHALPLHVLDSVRLHGRQVLAGALSPPPLALLCRA